MLRTGFSLLVISMCLSLSACSMLSNNEDSRVATASTALKVPETLSQPQYLDPYPIPAAPEGLPVELPGRKVKLVQPKPLEIIWDDQKVQLRKKGAREWLRLNAKPGPVWSHLRQFMKDNALPLERENTRLGLLESIWMPVASQNALLFSEGKPAAPSYRKLRIRIERGSDQDLSLLYIAIIEQPTPNKAADLDWTVSDALLPQTHQALVSLKDFLAKQDYSKTEVTLTGQGISTERLSEMTWRDGEATLQLRQDFNYAWQKVGDALKSKKYPVSDLNRGLGIYYLDLTDAKGKLHPSYHAILKNTDEKKTLNKGQLQVLVRSEAHMTFVRLKRADNAALSRGLQSAFLESLKEAME